MSVLRLALGDLKRFAKDWQAALWLIAMPLVFAYIFGSAMRGGGPQATWITVIDLDRSGLSKLFIEQLRQPEYWIEMKGAETQSQLKTKWPYGIVIPAGFGQAILAGKPVKATLVRGQVSPEKLMEVQSCLAHAIVRYTKGLVVADISSKTWNDDTKAALENALKRPQLLTLSRQSARTLKPPPTGFHQSLPGMLVMFVLQMIVTYGGASLVRDRLGGRMPRLFASPLSPFEVYAGKVLARVLLGILQAALLLLGGSLLFRIPLGDHPLFLAPVVLALALVAGALSVLAGLVCQTEKQVILTGIFSAMILSALGGCWWPIEIVPDAFKTIAACTPSYWGVHGLQSILYFGKSWQVLTWECPIIFGFAVLCGLLAVLISTLLSLWRRKAPSPATTGNSASVGK
jgi:ABC-2 type transport system permease protein